MWKYEMFPSILVESGGRHSKWAAKTLSFHKAKEFNSNEDEWTELDVNVQNLPSLESLIRSKTRDDWQLSSLGPQWFQMTRKTSNRSKLISKWNNFLINFATSNGKVASKTPKKTPVVRVRKGVGVAMCVSLCVCVRVCVCACVRVCVYRLHTGAKILWPCYQVRPDPQQLLDPKCKYE